MIETTTGRPRTGSLYWTKSGWRARLTIDVDGVAIQKSFNLETTSKAVARVKLARLLDAPLTLLYGGIRAHSGLRFLV